ncbi:MAG TPA: deoxyguanosinetriphosphate triphosphohydrolase [Terriglobales bacterium]|nr:deoxyguanosinetriphosphate triphosphohydrolase [Terriglobales bacterium]
MAAENTVPRPEPVAACAVREADTRGRRYPEVAHAYRGEYQRDRDRVIHARAFRRLENKTQVFSRRYSDHFRNRLTHTLEVTQISRTVAQALGLNSDLTETLALAHDLGHPPFGHAGEHALDQIMRSHGERFDHNLQALRIVEQFEVRYAAHPGLNLTYEVREGLVKHSRPFSAEEHPELVEYELALHPPLEAQLIDLTDEISYGGADLDDGFEAHLLTIEQMGSEVALIAELLEEVDRKFGALPPKLRFNEMLRRVLDYFVTDLIGTVAAAMPSLPSVGAVRTAPERLARFSSAAEQARQSLKAFLFRNLYQHPDLVRENRKAEQTVAAAFERFLSHPELLPASYRSQAATQPPQRVICDYIAGMTDSFIAQAQRERSGAWLY